MINNEYKFFEIINMAAVSSSNITSEGIFIFEDKKTSEFLKNQCSKFNIGFDDASADNELKFELSEISIFNNFDSFSTKFPEIVRTGTLNNYYCYFSKDESKLVILDTDDLNSYFFSHDEKLYKTDKTFEASNVFYWERIYETLLQNLSEENKTDKSFAILSYEKGKCFYEYSKYDRSFNQSNLLKLYNKLSETLATITDYKMLLKNRCVEHIDKSNSSSLCLLIQELDCICDKTMLDFEIFVSKIDFNSSIQKFKERIEFFISQSRDIVEKMLSNIFTLPLTYAGAIFAFDKLEDEKYASFIFLAMLLYTVLSCTFLIYELIDTFTIKKHLEKELSSYTNDSPHLRKDCQTDINAINRRIIGIRIICFILVITFVVLLIYLKIQFCNTTQVENKTQ